jgi:hypothetical protein
LFRPTNDRDVDSWDEPRRINDGHNGPRRDADTRMDHHVDRAPTNGTRNGHDEDDKDEKDDDNASSGGGGGGGGANDDHEDDDNEDDNEVMEHETDQTVVSLNVGGTLYQVSRSLFEQQHPDTMLARLVSETWQRRHQPDQDDNDDEDTKPTKKKTKKAIFIERDGARFGLVLDYLRDGSVRLPVTVSKAAFLSDLSYYGVEYNERRIDGVGTVAAVVARGHVEADRLREIARIAKERADYCQLANEVFAEYCRSGRLKFTPQWLAANTTVFEQSSSSSSPHLLQAALLAPHVEKYGLEVRGDPQSDWEGCLVLGHQHLADEGGSTISP